MKPRMQRWRLAPSEVVLKKTPAERATDCFFSCVPLSVLLTEGGLIAMDVANLVLQIIGTVCRIISVIHSFIVHNKKK